MLTIPKLAELQSRSESVENICGEDVQLRDGQAEKKRSLSRCRKEDGGGGGYDFGLGR